MSKHEKLVQKFITNSKSFTYEELVTLLSGFGYSEESKGRTSGSAVMFYNRELNDKIMIHKPHPGNELKKYLRNMIIEKLKANKML